jgi:outer membrane receptor protein involved in Fe transport
MGETFGAPLGELYLNLIGSHVYKYETFDFEDEPDSLDDERGEIGNPIDSAVANVRYVRGPLTVNWRIEYLDSMRLIEDDAARERESPYEADEIFYHDVQVRYLLEQLFGGDLTLYGGVTNLMDEDPPEYLTGVGEGSGIYDVFGRSFYVGANLRLGGGG